MNVNVFKRQHKQQIASWLHVTQFWGSFLNMLYRTQNSVFSTVNNIQQQYEGRSKSFAIWYDAQIS